MKNEEKDEITSQPENGVYTHGLSSGRERADKRNKRVRRRAYLKFCSPTRRSCTGCLPKRPISPYPKHDCPVYKTSDRRGVPATTATVPTLFALSVCLANARKITGWSAE